MQSLYRDALRYLVGATIDDAELTVLFVIEHVFEQSYLSLLSNDIVVSTEQYDHVFSILNGCVSGTPLAYLLGTVDFNGRTYDVDRGVLIPRPETEELVQYSSRIIRWLLNQSIASVIFECGVGTGVISIELSKLFPFLSLYGWDISSLAIKNAQKNCDRHHISNLLLHHGDFFEGLAQRKSASKQQVLVSNPPYISECEFDQLDEHVKREPKTALIAEEQGTAIISRLIDVSIQQKMILICEMGHNQRSFFQKKYAQYQLVFIQDLSGHDRFLVYFPSFFQLDDDLLNQLNQ
jgi:release factor glutamine methyltransferase